MSWPSFSSSESKAFSFWLFLTFMVAIILQYPYLDYQPLLSQGDHGRDLYAALQTLDGKLPYRDYWWVYGPLSPFYYAGFLKICGISIPSILLGKAVLFVVAAMFFYATLSRVTSPLFSFIGAVWFLLFQGDFFFTYNHMMGIMTLTIMVYGLVSYLTKQHNKFLYLSVIAVFFLMLIRINFGIIALGVLICTVWSADKALNIKFDSGKKWFYHAAFWFVPLLVFLIYFALLHDLPGYYIRQCLPYIGNYRLHNIPLSAGIAGYFKILKQNMFGQPFNMLFSLVVIASFIKLLIDIFRREILNKSVLIALGYLLVLYGLFLHEYLVSGVEYRLFWGQAFGFLFIFILLFQGLQRLPRYYYFIFVGGVALFLINNTVVIHKRTAAVKNNPGHYLSLPRTHVYTQNEPAWIDTVSQTSRYLQEHLAENELFFAFPYDCLYYYLTGKTTPTRLLIFFEHNYIPPQQEAEIIADLERQQVNWIVASNRVNSNFEQGLGIFGQTHCPLLLKYIEENFEIVEKFGNFSAPAGWAWNHATRILKRKSP